MTLNLGIVNESDEVDASDYVSKSQSSWNSSAESNYPDQIDESMMEREDVRAEQVAECAIRGDESLAASKKGTNQNQSTLFNDNESEDSDDETSEAANSKIDRKTIHQILRQHSGQDLQSEEVTTQKTNKSNVSSPAGTDIIGGEPDFEEEFVFQYVLNISFTHRTN